MQKCYKTRFLLFTISSVYSLQRGSGILLLKRNLLGKLFLATMMLSLFSGISYGQSIFSNEITGTNPSGTIPYTNGQVVSPGISVSGIKKGSGNGATNTTNSFSLNRFNQNAIVPSKCFEFEIEPIDCNEIDFVSFEYSGSLSSGSANFAFRSSADNFNSNIGTATEEGGTISLSASMFQNVTEEITFRLYIWGSASNSVYYSLNDFSFNGSVSPGGPTITTQPTSVSTYCQNGSPSPLTIAASANGGSITGYQWYSNNTPTNSGGSIISGANWLSYYPPGNIAGTKYYYCVVTKTGGCTATSNVGRVTITAQPSGNFSYSSYGYCNSETAIQTIASSNFVGAAGTFSAPSGLSINSSTGAIDPSLSTPSTSPYIVTYSVPASNGCNAYSSTTSVTIERAGAGTFSYPSSVLCKSTSGVVSPTVVGAAGTGNSTWFIGSPSGLAMNGSGVITPSSSNAGNYTVTYYRSASGVCPTYSISIPVSIQNGGTVNAGSSFTKSCSANSNGGTIGETNDGSTYSWTPSAGLSSTTISNPTANPSVTTTYTVTKGSGTCASTGQVTVTVNNTPPVANAGSGFTKTCSENTSGAQIGMTPVSGVSYSWSPSTGLSASNIANPIANPNATTTYTLTATNTSNNCSASSSVTVTVSGSNPTITSSSGASRCGAGTVVLSASPSAGTINWFSSSSGGTSLGTGTTFTTPSISTNTTYYAQVSNGACTNSTRTAVVATINSAPVITTQPVASSTYCQNSSPSPITISATAGAGSISTYQWFSNTSSSNTGGTSISGANWLSYYPPGNVAGTRYYYCVVTNSQGCSTTSNVGAVTITPQPSGNFSYSAYGYCNSVSTIQTIASSNFVGAQGTFSAPSGLSINSATGAINPSLSTPNSTPYTVTYTVPAGNGCSAYSSTTSVTIEMQGAGTFSFPSSTLCKGVSGTVSPTVVGAAGSGNSTWFLSAPGGLAMNGSGVITPSSSNAGNYTITYYRSASGTCPEYSTSIPLSIQNGGGPVNAGEDFLKTCTINPNGKVIGESNSGTTYSWTPATGLSSTTISNPTANPTVTTTYTVTKGSGACVASDEIVVTVDRVVPTANAGADFTKSCATNFTGASIGMEPVPGVTYSWSPTTGLSSSTIANPIANPSVTTTYTLTATKTSSGCTATDAVVVTVSAALPTITSSTGASRCGPGTVNLVASASAGTVNWYTSSTGGTPIGTGSPFTTPSLSATTTYYAEAMNGSCVSAVRTAVIATVNTIPTITSTTNASRCGSGTVALSAVASAGTYSWFTTETGGTSLGSAATYTTPSISITTTYYVSATSSGCTTPTRTPVTATVNVIPTVVSTVPGNRCGVGTVSLEASPSAGTINWFAASTGGTAIASGNAFTSPSISTNTTYYVSATEGNCTTASRTAVVATVYAIPTVTGSTPSSRCGSGTVTLAAVASSGTLNWYANPTGGASLGSGTSFISPSISESTSYYVDATANSCTSASRVAVLATINPQPTITSSTDASRCGNGTLVLNAAASAGTVRWYSAASGGSVLFNGSAYTTPALSSTTTYYAEAVVGSCASASRTAVIATVNANPTIASQTTPAATYVQNASANPLSVTANAGSGEIESYQWYSNTIASNASGTAIEGATTSTYIPLTTTAGNTWYYCLVTNSNGCFVKSAISGAILINALPTITSVIPTLPLVTEQENNTGYRGQRITINGTNFMANSTVNFNGTAAISVIFVNATQLTALVNNTGANSLGVVTVTNPTTSASATAPFSFIGYYTNAIGDWNSTATWLGSALPTNNADATIAHVNTCAAAVTSSLHQVTIRQTGVLTFSTANSSLLSEHVTNKGSIVFTGAGSLSISGDFILTEESVFTPGNGRVNFTKEGDQVLFTGKSTLSFNIVSLSGAGNKSLNNNSVLHVKNLNVATEANFNVGTSNQDVQLTGDLVLDGNMDPGTSKIRFRGTGDQTISVSGEGTALFSDLYVNKPSGLLKLSNNIQVRDTLKMIQGNVDTQGKLLEIGSGTSQPGIVDYLSGYITGKVRRWYGAKTNTGTSTGLFPMGQKRDNIWYNRSVTLFYTQAPSVGGHLTIEFMPEPMINGAIGTQTFIDPINTGGAGFTVSNFSNDGYWKIDNQSGSLTDGKYTISLTGEGFLSLENSLTQLTIVKRVNMGNWFCPGTHLPLVGDVYNPTLSRSDVTGFSNFGYAGGANDPLPITLVSFDAICDDSKVMVMWTTAAETNNKEFYIQESKDAINWETVATIPGAGNSTTMRDYSEEVESSYADGSYFRMTQVDYNGDSESFDPVFVTCGRKAKSELKIYPNPAIEFVNLEITSSMQMEVGLVLFNTSGQILLSQKVNLQDGVTNVRLDLTSIPPGSYHVNLSNTKNVEISGGRSIIKR